jgi:hypothetical protein
MPGTSKIRYVCQECGETGRILGWEQTPWNLTARNTPGKPEDSTGPVHPLTREKPGLPLELGRLGPIEKEILDYLRRYPRASDTVESITQYWLEGGMDTHGDFEVQDALDNLERNGLISVVAGPSGRKTYRMNTKRNN